MPHRSAWALTLALGLATSTALAADPVRVPPGAHAVEFPGLASDGGVLTVWTYRPAGLRPDDRIVFVMHGVERNADVYRDNWVRHAQAHRFLLVVPEMSQALFPGAAGYNLGNMVDRHGRPRPAAEWNWGIIERVFDAVRQGAGSRRSTYAIFGHSAGAQFVHRFMAFADNPRVEVAIAANAGWYTLPIESERFPYGLGGSAATPERIKANFAKPLVVLLGDRDTDPSYPNLRRDVDADRQGVQRFERGQNFMRVAAAAAARLDTPINWKVEVVPGVGHDHAAMSEAAIRRLFPARNRGP